MSARRKARKRALDFLYESDLRATGALALYDARPADDLSQEGYVRTILEGVALHHEKIDDIIITYAEGWDMDRMPAIDRNLLRISIYEVIWESDLDDKIAVNEAIELAGELSTEDSATYINGILGRVIAIKSTLID